MNKIKNIIISKISSVGKRKYYIDIVCKKSGWSKKKVKKEINKAQKMGIGYVQYTRKACWQKTDKELEFLSKCLAKKRERVLKERQEMIESICEKSGWSKKKVIFEWTKARKKYGASLADYYSFHFWELTEKEQSKFVTLDMFNRMRVKYNDHYSGVNKFDNKANFNTIFKDFIKRKWFINKEITYEEFLEKIKDVDSIIAKTINTTQGKGIHKFNLNECEDKKKLYDKIVKLPKSIVEEYVIQHDDLMDFCPHSVNTVRITTLNYNGECKLLYSVLRMGTGAVVDNFHAGGIAAGIDTKTGIVCTDGGNLDGDVFLVNPYSNKKIRGFQIPFWDEVLDFCNSAYDIVPEVKLVGWDIAITKDGIDLIEGNPGADHGVAQIPGNRGLKEIMVDPYL